MADRELNTTVSVHGRLGQGGLGSSALHCVMGLLANGARVHAICGGIPPDLTLKVATSPINLQILLSVLRHTPLRFRSDLVRWTHDEVFDRIAAKKIGPTQLFYGYSGESLHSIQAARRKGAVTILHGGTTHIHHLLARIREEQRKAGPGDRVWSPQMVRKMLREYETCDYIRVESTLGRDSMLRAGIPAEKVLLIPPCVDCTRFQLREKDDNTFRVAFVGYFSLRKGIRYLLAAFDELNLPRSELILHGGWTDRWGKRLVQSYLRRENIIWRQGDVAETYQQASVLVLPSIEDGFGYVVLEAMACGVPVIVSEGVGAKDAVTDGENGYVIPTGQAEALKEKLEFLYNHPERLNEMGRAAHEEASKYALSTQAPRMGRAFLACV